MEFSRLAISPPIRSLSARTRTPVGVGAQLPDGIVERRRSTRFPISLEVRYTALSLPGVAETRTGFTRNISSSGLSFTTEAPLLIGQSLRVSIYWPAQLNDGIELQLVVVGVVVGIRGAVTALRIQRHEFKTKGLKLLEYQGSPT
jgi:hypothetical protein